MKSLKLMLIGNRMNTSVPTGVEMTTPGRFILIEVTVIAVETWFYHAFRSNRKKSGVVERARNDRVSISGASESPAG
jgi:hypothetical protein